MNALEHVLKHKIIVIVRGLSSAHTLPFAKALFAGGIRLMEVTFDQQRPDTWPDTAYAIRAVREEYDGQMAVGAGTVLNQRQLAIARQAGAMYMVSPNVDAGIIAEAKAVGMGAFPGAMTPTEIASAYQAGADAVKLFPAGSLGPEYVKAVTAPLSHIPLIAVGGITEKNCADYLAAGAIGIGVGGSIVNKAWIEAGEWDKITALAKAYVRAVE